VGAAAAAEAGEDNAAMAAAPALPAAEFGTWLRVCACMVEGRVSCCGCGPGALGRDFSATGWCNPRLAGHNSERSDLSPLSR
jgi:hypothetical protein